MNTQIIQILLSNQKKFDKSKLKASSCKFFMDKELQLEVSILKRFMRYVCYLLDIDEVKVYLHNNRKNSGIRTTALCDYQNKIIKIYCKNRSKADIFRSIAHECTHIKQYELNEIPEDYGNHWSEPVEFEANATAGSILSFFSHKIGFEKVYEND